MALRYTIVFGHPDRSLFCRDPDPSIKKQKIKKTPDFYMVFWLLIFEDRCKCTLKFLSAACRPLTKKQNPCLDPDQLVSGADPDPY